MAMLAEPCEWTKGNNKAHIFPFRPSAKNAHYQYELLLRPRAHINILILES